MLPMVEKFKAPEDLQHVQKDFSILMEEALDPFFLVQLPLGLRALKNIEEK